MGIGSATGAASGKAGMNSAEGAAQPHYVIVTPARDEEEHIEGTIKSVLSQTVLPAEWILVDDGSRDKTGEIVDRYARQVSWISPLHRTDRGFRHPAVGVMEAFYDGYKSLKSAGWEFIVKLDGDLSMERDYFERCFQEFREDPKLGIGGGSVYHVEGSQRRFDSGPQFHVRGATKIYRRQCWDSLGGLVRAPGWDTVDEFKANMLGWRTRTFPNIEILQHRATGSADGAWKNAVKDGQADYVCGYHPAFMLLKCVKRVFERPFLFRALGLMWGFIGGHLSNVPQIEEKALIRYVRRQQMRRLLLMDSMWS